MLTRDHMINHVTKIFSGCLSVLLCLVKQDIYQQQLELIYSPSNTANYESILVIARESQGINCLMCFYRCGDQYLSYTTAQPDATQCHKQGSCNSHGQNF